MRQNHGAANGRRSEGGGSDSNRPELSRAHRVLVGVVVTGAVVIAGIGFAGSYNAVRALAEEKHFGVFAVFFPIGIDAGICVLLALDLLLTWIRIPFPLLRQAAWVLTAATIAFNGASAWPDPLGVGMHAVIPLLFIVTVEAARHAVGRIADITADKHMEGVRLTRWLLSPAPTFMLWRRMKLWELRKYEQVIRLERDRLVYQSHLQAKFGRAWRRKAPVQSLMPLRLAKYGVPLAQTAAAGLEAAGIDVPAELAPRSADAPASADLERLDVLEEPPTADATAEHPELGPAVEPLAAQDSAPLSTADEAARQPLAAAGVAAEREARPRPVQARIGDEWTYTEPLLQEGPSSGPELADEVSVGSPAPAPIADEGGEGSAASAPEPALTGLDLLEYRYLQLPEDQRSLSAVKLAELLHEGTGFTAGTARKYLGDIIRKHR